MNLRYNEFCYFYSKFELLICIRFVCKMFYISGSQSSSDYQYLFLVPAAHGMGAPQEGRRDHREAITLPSLRQECPGCNARVSWFTMRRWATTRTGYFFYFVAWGGTSPHKILAPETECTKPIQSLNNYQLTTILLLLYVSEDRLEPTSVCGPPFRKAPAARLFQNGLPDTKFLLLFDVDSEDFTRWLPHLYEFGEKKVTGS